MQRFMALGTLALSAAMAIGAQGAPAQEHALQNSLNNEDDVSGRYRCCPHRVDWYERIGGIKRALER